MSKIIIQNNNIQKENLKPYQLKYLKNMQIMKDFVNEKNGFEMLADVLNIIMSDDVQSDINISVGKRTNDGFAVYLNAHTDTPEIGIGCWNDNEPTFCIKDKKYRSSNVLCSINFTFIENLSVDISSGSCCRIYKIFFSYGEIDYNILIKIKS